MPRLCYPALLVALAAVSAFGPLAAQPPVADPQVIDPPVAHMVFFTLADDSPANRETLVSLCHEHLGEHEGTLYFSVGEIAEGLDREVNDKRFQVALHMVFDGLASHDKYQEHPRHYRFIEEVKPLLSGVRVFDSRLRPANNLEPPQPGHAPSR